MSLYSWTKVEIVCHARVAREPFLRVRLGSDALSISSLYLGCGGILWGF